MEEATNSKDTTARAKVETKDENLRNRKVSMKTKKKELLFFTEPKIMERINETYTSVLKRLRVHSWTKKIQQ